jgi:hypothetical protein
LESRTGFSRRHELLITQGSLRRYPRLPLRDISADLGLVLRAQASDRTEELWTPTAAVMPMTALRP